jgi:hypothetical protein
VERYGRALGGGRGLAAGALSVADDGRVFSGRERAGWPQARRSSERGRAWRV